MRKDPEALDKSVTILLASQAETPVLKESLDKVVAKEISLPKP
jgi:hypothetical protein